MSSNRVLWDKVLKRRGTVFFDLFYTLVNPKSVESYNENDVLGIDRGLWERSVEDDELYARRASGKVINAEAMIDEILLKMGRAASGNQKREILRLWEKRMRNALMSVDTGIVHVIRTLRNRGWGLCVISNADAIDTMHWTESPLYSLFHHAVFSHEVGWLKPQSEIYRIALNKMNEEPSRCIFVGDGGSDELRGAKQVGMTTILTTQYRSWKNTEEHLKTAMQADHEVQAFVDILHTSPLQEFE